MTKLTTGQLRWREKSAPKVLSEENKKYIRELYTSGLTMTAIAQQFGVVISTISRVINSSAIALSCLDPHECPTCKSQSHGNPPVEQP